MEKYKEKIFVLSSPKRFHLCTNREMDVHLLAVAWKSFQKYRINEARGNEEIAIQFTNQNSKPNNIETVTNQ